MTLLNALDGWETNRRSKTKHQDGSREKALEEQRRHIFDSSRELVLQCLRRPSLLPVDETSTPAAWATTTSSPASLVNLRSPTNEGPPSLLELPPESEERTSTAPYRCPVKGCSIFFSHQSLLSSHMNVHNVKRIYFCSVDGCPRGPGGRGFKRKNEMIRFAMPPGIFVNNID